MKRTAILRKTPLVRSSRLRRVSVKRRKLDAVYFRRRRIFLGLVPVCQCCTEEWENGRTKQLLPSCDIHHTKGRGKHYLDESTWMAICRQHHNWIGDNPKAAEARGWIVRRTD